MTSRASFFEKGSPSRWAKIRSILSGSGTKGQPISSAQSSGSDVRKHKLYRPGSPPLEKRTDPWGFATNPCTECKTGTVSRYTAGSDWRDEDDDPSKPRPPSPAYHSMCPSCSRRVRSDGSSSCSLESLLEGPTHPVDLSPMSTTGRDSESHPTTENRPSASSDSQQPKSGLSSLFLPTATGVTY